MFSVLVVVPTFDSYRLLPRLVESLETQTFRNWRVLFVDGKSSLTHKNWLREHCHNDSRFQWEEETCNGRGIFAAMNQGFKHALESDWLLFWGSDDIAACTDSFKRVEERILRAEKEPDLYVCSAQYYSTDDLLDDCGRLKKTRYSRFLFRKTFRNSLFWGSTPPHQATFFGPGARRIVNQYNETYELSGDLDYFLNLSQNKYVSVVVDSFLLVLMGDSGVSRRKSLQRFSEVIRTYKHYFKSLWLFPFTMRYIQRLWSIRK